MGDIAADKCSRAYSFCLNEDMSAKEFLTAHSLSQNFYLPLSTVALSEVRQLQQLASSISLADQDRDSWAYPWGAAYTSKAFYQFCLKDSITHDAFNWIWKARCTPRVKFFCWILFFDRFNTRSMLRRRNDPLNYGVNCAICSIATEETSEHLFFHCPFSKRCWNILKMRWQLHGNLLDIITEGRDRWCGPMFMEIFMLAAWNIWKERNKLVFNALPLDLTGKRDS
jgi:hypothetical protein